MLIFDEHSKPILIDQLTGPVIPNYSWVLDLNLLDFTLSPLVMLEEITCPILTLQTESGFKFKLPAYWHLLVYDRETTQLDLVQLSDLTGKQFTAAASGPNTSTVHPVNITVIDYDSLGVYVSPSLNKHQMICHPISPKLWVNVTPSDVFNKYLKGKDLGDIF
jgi:hypothetical protein